MGRPKGSKNATSRVAHTKSAPQQAASPKASTRNRKTGNSVSRSVARVRRPRKTGDGATRITSRGTYHSSTTGKSRAKKAIQKAPDVIIYNESDIDEKEAWILIGFAAVVIFLLGVFLGRMLP